MTIFLPLLYLLFAQPPAEICCWSGAWKDWQPNDRQLKKKFSVFDDRDSEFLLWKRRYAHCAGTPSLFIVLSIYLKFIERTPRYLLILITEMVYHEAPPYHHLYTILLHFPKEIYLNNLFSTVLYLVIYFHFNVFFSTTGAKNFFSSTPEVSL